jgi:phosphatidate cytidylyltransferase
VGLGQRLLAAAVFVPSFVIICWRGDVYFVLLVDFILVVGMREYQRMLEAKGLTPWRPLGIGAALALPWLAFLNGGAWIEFGLALLLLIALTVELFRGRGEALMHIAGSTLGVMYVAWLGSHLVLLRELPLWTGQPYVDGFRIVSLVLLLTWMADTGAYLLGSVAGRHKLAPRISPGKSVEGAFGGVLLAAAAGVVAALTFMRHEIGVAAGAGIGALAAVVGLLGDLSESLLKRDAHVKDASHAIPGHGGVLDRFDSVLFTAPLLYYVLRYFVS